MIDFHSHFFSSVFFETLAKLSVKDDPAGDPRKKLEAAAAKAGLALPGADVAAHWKRWEGELDRHGVDHLVSFASVPEEAPVLAQARQIAAGRMTPFALVNPKMEGAPAKVRALLGTQGFKGVLLFPAMHQFDLASPEALAVFEAVDEHRACAVVHCGLLQIKLRDLLGIPRTYDFTLADPLRLVPAADRFRGARFIIPHFGAGMLRETLMLGAACANVRVDTSSSNDWMKTEPSPIALKDVFMRCLGVFGAKRILFGTDSSTFPRGWRHDLRALQRDALAACGATEAEQALIFDGNARELLGL